MNVLIVSGIWPPDVGGPASHAPELAEFLLARGHRIEAVTTADRAPAAERYPVRWTPRRLPVGLRHLHAAALIAARARRADVVYSTGMVGRSALAAALTSTPLVLKLTSDPAYERALRYGLHDVPLDRFQAQRGLRLAVLRRLRDFALARAARIVCPSRSLSELAAGWGEGGAAGRAQVLPNPVDPPALPPREELRARHALSGDTLVFAGRLAPQKSLDVALRALARLPDVQLVLAGDGPERQRLHGLATELGLDGRVRFLGPQPRQAIFELLAAADAVVLPSSWENFPHVLVEALAVGTPVVATDTGGVREIVDDGVAGLLVPAGDADALAAAVRRVLGDPELRARLAGAAAASVARFSPEEVYGRLEQVLTEAAAR